MNNSHGTAQRANILKGHLTSRRPQRHGSRGKTQCVLLDGESVGNPYNKKEILFFKKDGYITNKFGFFHCSWIPDVQSAATRAFAPGSLLSLGTTGGENI